VSGNLITDCLTFLGEKAELLVHVGDFEYCDDAELWKNQLEATLGEGFPILGILVSYFYFSRVSGCRKS
jgi:hypothetical protein